MVVPVPATNLSKTKKIVGNNLNLSFSTNLCTIVVIGNNCSLKIADNFGVVKVVGNNCVITIGNCSGSVKYVGNNGKITLNCKVKEGAVSYSGNNGFVTTKNGSSAQNLEPSTEYSNYGTSSVILGNIISCTVNNNWSKLVGSYGLTLVKKNDTKTKFNNITISI